MEATHKFELNAVPDDELLRRLADLVAQSRRLEADLVAHIGEVDERKLFARFAFPSMFAYCTEGLHLRRRKPIDESRWLVPRVGTLRCSRSFGMVGST